MATAHVSDTITRVRIMLSEIRDADPEDDELIDNNLNDAIQALYELKAARKPEPATPAGLVLEQTSRDVPSDLLCMVWDDMAICIDAGGREYSFTELSIETVEAMSRHFAPR